MKDSDSKIPDQKELEKELNEYLGKKYGDRIRLVVPMLFPKTETEEASKEEKEPAKGKWKINFDLKPEELEAFLNDYIIQHLRESIVVVDHDDQIRLINESARIPPRFGHLSDMLVGARANLKRR